MYHVMSMSSKQRYVAMSGMYVCMHVCVYVCMYVYVYVCMHVCVCVTVHCYNSKNLENMANIQYIHKDIRPQKNNCTSPLGKKKSVLNILIFVESIRAYRARTYHARA